MLAPARCITVMPDVRPSPRARMVTSKTCTRASTSRVMCSPSHRTACCRASASPNTTKESSASINVRAMPPCELWPPHDRGRSSSCAQWRDPQFLTSAQRCASTMQVQGPNDGASPCSLSPCADCRTTECSSCHNCGATGVGLPHLGPCMLQVVVEAKYKHVFCLFSATESNSHDQHVSERVTTACLTQQLT